MSKSVTYEQWRKMVIDAYPNAVFRNSHLDHDLESEDPDAWSAFEQQDHFHPDFVVGTFQPKQNFANFMGPNHEVYEFSPKLSGCEHQPLTIMQALRTVDRSPGNQVDIRYDYLTMSLGMPPIPEHLFSEVENMLHGYWVVRWNSHDTWVGIQAIYRRDELVGMSIRASRTNPPDYLWVNEAAYQAVRDWLQSVADQAKTEPDLIEDQSIDSTYRMTSKNQIVDLDAFYQGLPVKIDLQWKSPDLEKGAEPANSVGCVGVEHADGRKELIPVSQLQFKLRLGQKEWPVFSPSQQPDLQSELEILCQALEQGTEVPSTFSHPLVQRLSTAVASNYLVVGRCVGPLNVLSIDTDVEVPVGSTILAKI